MYTIIGEMVEHEGDSVTTRVLQEDCDHYHITNLVGNVFVSLYNDKELTKQVILDAGSWEDNKKILVLSVYGEHGLPIKRVVGIPIDSPINILYNSVGQKLITSISTDPELQNPIGSFLLESSDIFEGIDILREKADIGKYLNIVENYMGVFEDGN